MANSALEERQVAKGVREASQQATGALGDSVAGRFQGTLFYPLTGASRANPRFALTLVFIASAFVMSNDNALKLGSISAASLTSVAMLAVSIVEALAKGSFDPKPHPLQAPLFLIFIWASISLMLSSLIPGKAFPAETYALPWAVGINSPEYRGFSFLIRLFLSIFAIDFVISALSDRKRIATAINFAILLHATAVCFGLLQFILYAAAGVRLGSVITVPFLRIGGYVGEPQTYGLLLVTMTFPVIGAIRYGYEGCRYSKRTLKLILSLTAIALALTFSVSMILSVLSALLIFRKGVKGRTLVKAALFTGVIIYSFHEFVSSAITGKLISEALTINSRTLTWKIGMEMIADNLVTGVGIGQSPLLTKAVSGSINLNFDSLDFEAFRVAILNSYIEWTAETGVIGLALLVFAGSRIYSLGKGMSSKESDFVRFSFGGSLVALAISANSYGSIFYIGCFNLLIAMYVAGMMAFKNGKS